MLRNPPKEPVVAQRLGNIASTRWRGAADLVSKAAGFSRCHGSFLSNKSPVGLLLHRPCALPLPLISRPGALRKVTLSL